jgi:hypothetical protein
MLRFIAGSKVALALAGMIVLAGCSKSEKPDLLYSERAELGNFGCTGIGTGLSS